MKENKKFQSKKKDNNKGKRRDEPLSTSIGDILKSKGFEMPKANLVDAEAKVAKTDTPNKNNVSYKLDMHDPEVSTEVVDSTIDALFDAFTSVPEEKKESPNTYHIGSEYITKNGSDKRVRTDTFITKNK
jgi:hypothetical protein